MDKKAIELIKEALFEDGVDNDITTLNLVSKDKMLTGSFIVKATGVVSGIDVAKEVFKQINPRIKMEILKAMVLLLTVVMLLQQLKAQCVTY